MNMLMSEEGVERSLNGITIFVTLYWIQEYMLRTLELALKGEIL